ncbi:hypothetical protein L6452_00525 [Arctium lappa]|uniref:Uncharacterized protein n=1 Tax=Arctium lappa TaxID=4217 RepID=A0ACB9FER6_ARCLA|nr:hypothetical protein L6452_00525 [Arctium lappa]
MMIVRWVFISHLQSLIPFSCHHPNFHHFIYITSSPFLLFSSKNFLYTNNNNNNNNTQQILLEEIGKRDGGNQCE